MHPDLFKKLEKLNHDNKVLEELSGQPQFDLSKKEEYQATIKCDESVSPAMFKKNPQNPDEYLANSLTIRAMNKDLFLLGNDIDFREDIYECICGKNVDLQFWKLCPYCAREIN